jgi:hypothetical protein
MSNLDFSHSFQECPKRNLIYRQISQQPGNCENRNDPDLVKAFLKKWWIESDFKAPNKDKKVN